MLEEIAKTLIGTFTGAGLALIVNRMLDASKRHRESVAAGNLALFAIKGQLNEFLLFRKGLYEDMADPNRPKGTPIWGMIRPSFQTYQKHVIDFSSLGFLFLNRKNRKLLDKLLLCQTTFDDLVALDSFRNDAVVELHRELARLRREKPQNTLQQDEDDVGLFIVGKVSSSIKGLVQRARDSELLFRDAFGQLRQALEEEFNAWHRRDFGSLMEFIAMLRGASESLFIDIKDTEPEFRLENLPALPPLVAQHVAN